MKIKKQGITDCLVIDQPFERSIKQHINPVSNTKFVLINATLSQNEHIPQVSHVLQKDTPSTLATT